MVTILNRRRHGFDVVVYPNDHRPAHVHVFRGENEVLVNIDDWTILDNYGFRGREIRQILKLLRAHEALLRETWDRYPGSLLG